MKLYELDEMIKVVAPIHGVNSNGDIFSTDEATDEQRLAAKNIMDEHLATLEFDGIINGWFSPLSP